MAKERSDGFLSNLARFIKREDGLVTVEWVALASAVVVGGIALIWVVMDNLKAPASQIGSNINPLATTDPGR